MPPLWATSRAAPGRPPLVHDPSPIAEGDDELAGWDADLELLRHRLKEATAEMGEQVGALGAAASVEEGSRRRGDEGTPSKAWRGPPGRSSPLDVRHRRMPSADRDASCCPRCCPRQKLPVVFFVGACALVSLANSASFLSARRRPYLVPGSGSANRSELGDLLRSVDDPASEAATAQRGGAQGGPLGAGEGAAQPDAPAANASGAADPAPRSEPANPFVTPVAAAAAMGAVKGAEGPPALDPADDEVAAAAEAAHETDEDAEEGPGALKPAEYRADDEPELEPDGPKPACTPRNKFDFSVVGCDPGCKAEAKKVRPRAGRCLPPLPRARAGRAGTRGAGHAAATH